MLKAEEAERLRLEQEAERARKEEEKRKAKEAKAQQKGKKGSFLDMVSSKSSTSR